MKRYVIFLMVFTISFPAYTQPYERDNVTSGTIAPFLNALKSGDTTKLLQYIDGPIYRRTKVLLNQNSDYTDLLKNKYGEK